MEQSGGFAKNKFILEKQKPLSMVLTGVTGEKIASKKFLY